MSGYIGQFPDNKGANNETRVTFIATAGQTIFNIAYQPGYLDVFVNGVLQTVVTDYAATSGASFVMVTGLAVGDEVVASARYASAPLDSYTRPVIDAALNLKLNANANAVSSTDLLNTAPLKLPSITATAATGALTFSAASRYLDFGKALLTDGTNDTLLAAPANLVLPSGGTLGTPTTLTARIVLVEMNIASVAELAVVNIAGGNDLSEAGVISTTAISATSTANNVFYSTTARTGVAYRVVGIVDAVNTAGAWAAPTLVRGAGWNAVSAISSLGYGQKWQDVAASRAAATTYYNTTGRPIVVQVTLIQYTTTSANSSFLVDGVIVCKSRQDGGAAAISDNTMSVIVGAGLSYSISSSLSGIDAWTELR